MIEIALENPILKESIVDGEGIRTVIFFQGCLHNCKGCHNPLTHRFGAGQEFTKSMQDEFIKNLENNPMIKGVTFSGGDVIFQVLDNDNNSAKEIVNLAKRIKDIGKDIWLYTGFKLDNLRHLDDKNINELLSTIDVIVDGEYKESQKTLTEKFMGSYNQRIIYLNNQKGCEA